MLNKTDLVGPPHIEVIRDWIDLQLKRIRIVETSHGDAPLEVLLGSGRFDPSRMPFGGNDVHRQAGPPVERWSYRTQARFSADALRHMVKRELPASVYRCKGIIFTTDSDQPHALQVVGRRCEITPVDLDRPVMTGTSELVAIGRNIDGPELDRLFGACESAAHREVPAEPPGKI